jgi:hypothetical protein
MIPFTVARVAASRHAANYRRGDEPRPRSSARAALVVAFCREIDRGRALFAEALQSPVHARQWAGVVRLQLTVCNLA